MKKKIKKHMMYSLGLVLMVFQAVGADKNSAELSANEIRLPIGTVTEVAEFQIKTYPGRVVPVEQVNVIPQVSGEILEIGFENGAHVQKGDLLYRLDSIKYEAAVKNAEAKVAECKATLSYAELSYARHKKLVGTRAVSLDAVDNALSARDSAKAALAAAQADLTVAKDNLRHCRIEAPIAGKIGTTVHTEGNYVTPNSGVLVSLVQTSPLRVSFSISNRDYLEMFNAKLVNLQDHAAITLSLSDGRDYNEKGEIEYVENMADERTDTLRVYVKFPNKQQILNIGTTVGVTLSSKIGVKRPAIPPTAILQDIQGPYVWVVEKNGSAVRRTIARGDLNGDWLIVEKGLKAGEKLVIQGAHKVRKGMKVVAAE